MRGPTIVELCAGTASLTLWAMGRVRPLTGYMGSKQRDAAALARMLCGSARPERAVIVDAGPWGDVWAVLQHADGRRAVVAALRALHTRGDLVDVWPDLVKQSPPEDDAQRVAQYLCLQARAAGCIPVWWSEAAGRWESPSGARYADTACDLATRQTSPGVGANGRWVSPSGGRTHADCAEVSSPARAQVEAAHQRGVTAAEKRCKQPTARRVGLYRSRPSRGLVRIATLAERVDSLDAIDWSRVTVIHGDVRDVAPVPCSRVYFDPPYHGCPRYAVLLPRADVLAVAERHAEVADIVVVSEAEALPLPGWLSASLRAAGKPEVVTYSRALPPARLPRVERQMALTLGAV